MREKSSDSVKIKYAPSKERVEKVLSVYFKRLRSKFDVKLGVLFGSYAKGSYSWGSDIDVLIVASDFPKDMSKRFSMLVDLKLPLQVQPFGYTVQEFRKMLKERHPLITEVLKEGQVLYATQEYRSLVEKLIHK